MVLVGEARKLESLEKSSRVDGEFIGGRCCVLAEARDPVEELARLISRRLDLWATKLRCLDNQLFTMLMNHFYSYLRIVRLPVKVEF